MRIKECRKPEGFGRDAVTTATLFNSFDAEVQGAVAVIYLLRYDMKVYLVTFDGYCDSYGSEIYCGGIFETLEKAEDYVESICVPNKLYFTITEIYLNEWLELTKSDYEYSTDKYLGGYTE